MNLVSRLCYILLLLSFGGISLQAGGDKAPQGFLADCLAQIDAVESQITSLEQAIPQEKFTWRPAEGVRSVSEVYLHAAGGNYYLLTLAGYAPPKELNFVPDAKKWEGQTIDRAEIARILKESYNYLRTTVRSINDAELERKVDYFGTEVTLRGLLINIINHSHEHLGQSIAYARMNGIVPPWTAAREAKAREKSN